MSKVAFITGITGQDGAHLAAHLIRDGGTVYGGFRRGSSNKTGRLEALGIVSKVNLVEFQLSQHILKLTDYKMQKKLIQLLRL